MAFLPDELIDLTVTSPPYNIGKEYKNTLPLDDYINWCEKWIHEVYRLTSSRLL
ncbi:DNA methyltransferase [Anabaena azotica]|uniref:DNA methyltransferase n=1 Tax=Anabaena azotica TaxID=197653 RepID=UPI0039A55A83